MHWGRIALIGAGVLAAVDVTRYLIDRNVDEGGTPKGTATGFLVGHFHQIMFGVRHIMHPGRIGVLSDTNDAARAVQERVFPRKQYSGSDDVADAFRHVFGTATATYRLVHDHGMSAEDAIDFVRDAGLAHEADSRLDGPHYDNARAMDIHNNDVGMALGVEAAVSNAEPDLEGDTIHAIADGDAWMLGPAKTKPRPTSVVDLGEVAKAYGLS